VAPGSPGNPGNPGNFGTGDGSCGKGDGVRVGGSAAKGSRVSGVSGSAAEGGEATPGTRPCNHGNGSL